MLIAIPIHLDRISPLFDLAKRALLVEIVDHCERQSTEIFLVPPPGTRRGELLAQAGVDHVVCAAISAYEMEDLLGCGLVVWPCVVGPCREITQALAAEGGLGDRFRMPGCGLPSPGTASSCRDASGPRHWGWRRPGDPFHRRLTSSLASTNPD